MKLFGIPVKIEVSFFIVVAFLGMSRATSAALIVEWIVVVLVSILFHELGHAFAARVFGLSPSIRLYQMGGQTSWQSEINVTPLRHLIISLSGPAVGFVVGAAVFLSGPALLAASQSELLIVAYGDLLWVNVWWGVFNLLPMLPLDGGQVLVTLEAWILGRKDQLVAHALSFVVALTIAALALSGRSVWIAFLGIWFAYINGDFLWRRWQARRDRKLDPDLNQIRQAIEEDKLDDALDRIIKVQKNTKSHGLKRQVAQFLIFVYIKQQNYAAAETELRRFAALFGEDPYLQGVLHFSQGDMKSALPFLKTAFEVIPDKQLGLMISEALFANRDFAGVLELCEHAALTDVRWQLRVNVQAEAFNDGQFKVSAQAGSLAFEHKADPNVAYNVACAFARNSDLREAIEWARRAVDSGFNNREALVSDPDLEALRSLSEFSSLVAKLDKDSD